MCFSRIQGPFIGMHSFEHDWFSLNFAIYHYSLNACRNDALYASVLIRVLHHHSTQQIPMLATYSSVKKKKKETEEKHDMSPYCFYGDVNTMFFLPERPL